MSRKGNAALQHGGWFPAVQEKLLKWVIAEINGRGQFGIIGWILKTQQTNKENILYNIFSSVGWNGWKVIEKKP